MSAAFKDRIGQDVTAFSGEIQINANHITLPSGNQLALDAQKSFTPNPEFWQLWNENKLAVKQAGIAVTRERGHWRGYVRGGTGTQFSYPKSDPHQLWIDKARELAESEPIPEVILPAKDLSSGITPPCRDATFVVIVKVCRNDTFQLRLFCTSCQRKTPGAIKWEHFPSDVIIRAIAHALQNEKHERQPKRIPLFDDVREVDTWV